MSADNFIGVYKTGALWAVSYGSMSRSDEDAEYRGAVFAFCPSYEKALLLAHRQEEIIGLVEYGVITFQAETSAGVAEKE